MGTLVFVCPTTGLEVVTGLEMDQATFAALSTVLPDIRCPHCANPHQLLDVASWLAEGERKHDGAGGTTASHEAPPSLRSALENFGTAP